MELLQAYEAEYALIESWLDMVLPQACVDAGLEVMAAQPPEHVSVIARDERWLRVSQEDCVDALLNVYTNTTRCNVVIIADPSTPADFLSEKVRATTVGAKQIGWTFLAVDDRRLVCFFEDMDLTASSGRNSGWVARDLARMLRWLLSRGTAF